ncbi:twin-arginine translocase TatA/TatE family subunit [Streptomyces sp. NPDC091267]|uniref:twin-arginine translocase TatA/TatE family subunit n=1 Tax=unclassified Streptomyces TaxID=2593676 RepID=UPI0034308983
MKTGREAHAAQRLRPWDLLLAAVVLLTPFGSKKLPYTVRTLGKSARILKSEAKAMKA